MKKGQHFNSDPTIAKAVIKPEGSIEKLYVYGLKQGTTTLTLTTMDGSDAVCKVTVRVTESP